MAATRLTIFNRAGAALAELNVHLNMAWQLQQASSLKFAIAKTDAKCTEEILAFRNLVLAENDLVGNWVGFIWFPRNWDDDTINVTALSAERLFEFRLTNANDILTGTGGAIAQSLAAIANNTEQTGITISTSNIQTIGDSLMRTYHHEVTYKALNKLAEDTDSFWWIDGARSASNVLQMTFNWRMTRGLAFSTWLEDGGNFKCEGYTEEGGPVTDIVAWGKFSAWASPIEASVYDTDARATYGLIQFPYPSLQSEDIPSVTAVANAQLNQRRQHRHLAKGKVLKAPFPRIGDTVTARLIKHGFGENSGFGGNLTLLVHGASFDTKKNVLDVVLRETDA